MSDSRFRGCSPSQKREAPPSRVEHAFTGMQPGGSLWEGISLAGPPTMRPLRASLSVQGTLGQLGPTLLGWGSCQEARREGLPTLAFHHQPPHHSHLQSNLASQEPPDSLLLLPSQALPPRRPCRTAAGNETALLRSFFLKTQPVRDAGSISCTPSEACPSQSSPHEGRTRATRPGCMSSVSEATSLRCQQESHSGRHVSPTQRNAEGSGNRARRSALQRVQCLGP